MPAGTEQITADPAKHVVQFYGSDADAADRVSSYLAAGLRAGETAIIMATPTRRRAVEERLAATSGATPAQAGDRFIALDAAATMSQILVGSRPDRRALEHSLGGLIRDALTTSPAVRLYGEMVALLWQARHPGAAVELESLWNDLARGLPTRTLCGYPAELVAEDAGALRDICDLHTAVAGIPPLA